MNSNIDNFNKWFINPLAPLRSNGDAGFIFALVAFPLLERYLREKSGSGEAPTLNTQFYPELCKVIPQIRGMELEFWQCYRNGLLHQASFSQQKVQGTRITLMPSAGISGHDKRPVYYHTTEKGFYLNPIEFFDLVTNTILADFAAYEGSLSRAHPLPQIVFPGSATPGVTPTITPISFSPATGNYLPPPPPPPPIPPSSST